MLQLQADAGTYGQAAADDRRLLAGGLDVTERRLELAGVIENSGDDAPSERPDAFLRAFRFSAGVASSGCS